MKNGLFTNPAPRLIAIGFGALLILAVAAPSTRAATLEEIEQRIAAHQGELDRLRSELEQQKQIMAKQAQQIESQKIALEKRKEDEASTIKASTKGGLKLETADGAFKAQMGGRLYLDTAFYDSDKTNLGDGTEAREARIYLAGKMFRVWDYKWAFGFADNAVSAKDVTIAYAGVPRTSFKIGHMKEPFGLEESTSSRYISFMERGLPSAFAPGRHIGAAVTRYGDFWWASAGVFGDSFSNDPVSEGDEGWDVAGRLAFFPIHEDRRVLHFGASGRYNNPNNNSVTISSEPESHVTDADLVTTGALTEVDHTVTLGAEIGAAFGPLAVQGEYVHRSLERTDGASDPDFWGAYGEISYFLTGESRPYDIKKGGFTRITPNQNVSAGGWGAWQVATRYSILDLSDKDINGGIERNITLGLNWYLNPYLRVMANYIFVNTDNDATGNSANLKAGETFAGDDDPSIFQLRGQIDF